MSSQPTIGIIGAGHMGLCLVAGLVADNYPADRIWINDCHTEKLESLQQNYDVHISTQLHTMINHCDMVILAVKPQHIMDVCTNMTSCLERKLPLIISIAAGITIQQLQQALGAAVSIIRAMPNTPALLKCGATALYASGTVSLQQCEWAEMLMRAVGTVVWLEQEAHMDVVTALSGSGPAYFFWLMENMQKAAIAMGLAPKTAELLTVQTALGAAKMAMSSDSDVATLRAQVSSPRGTTEQAMQYLEQQGAGDLIAAALQAAHKRATQISKENR